MIVLDSGALIAVERRSTGLAKLLDMTSAAVDEVARIPATVVAQVWRTGRDRQAPLARLVAAAAVDPLDAARAREVGQLLADSQTDDITDAHVVAASDDGDLVITSDPVHIARLAQVAHKQIAIVTV